MPLSYSIDPDQGIVTTQATGTLTDQDILAHKLALISDSDFGSGMCELSDVRSAEEFAVTGAGIAAFVSFDRDHAEAFETHRLALIVPEGFVMEMGRVYEMAGGTSRGGNVNIFTDEGAARKWLGLDPRGDA